MRTVLILGGTGAIGEALRQVLINRGDKVVITSRSAHVSSDENTVYIQGDAFDKSFLEKLFIHDFDAIVDCLIYPPDLFNERVDLLLSGSKHYFFISSSRVFANTDGLITEDSNKLIDVISDTHFIESKEYAILKALEEKRLLESEKKNWTIVRPYITFSPYRLQLGTFEKENWLYRVLHSRTIVFPEALMEKRTTMTYCGDVATAISELIGNTESYGESFNISSSESHTWGEIISLYDHTLKLNGYKSNIVLDTGNSGFSTLLNNSYQFIYDRNYNREFSNDKLRKFIDIEFTPTLQRLDYCLNEFLSNPLFLDKISWHLQAEMDKIAGNNTPIFEVKGLKNKVSYMKYRYF